MLILNGEFASFDPLSRPALNLGAEPRDLIQGVNALQSDVEFATSMREVADRAKTFPIKEAGRGFRSLGLGRDVGIVTRDLSKLSRSVRSLARQDALALYAARREIYDPILSMSVLAVRERAPIDATLILLAACQDYQTAADGELNGAFTGTLKKVWNENYEGTYEGFLNRIKRRMNQEYFDQVPNYVTLGASNEGFQNTAQRPFSVMTE